MAFDTKMCEGLMKHPLETRHYDGGAGGFIIIPGSCSVLAAGAVVCGAASELARPDRFGAGRARSAPPAGETHTPVIGVYDVWGAALVGIGGDEADCLMENGRQVFVKACQPGARDSVSPGGRAIYRTGVVPHRRICCRRLPVSTGRGATA